MLLNIKRWKISSYGLGALGIIAFAVLLRLILSALGWPPTNSDESTMGLIAIHMATFKDFAFFLYNRYYMGSVEACIAAALFHIFGTSLFTLRLADILLFAVTLISMYLLAALLYTKRLALVSIGLLSIGSVMVLFTELMAHGGYPELLALGTLAFTLASYLALTAHRYHSARGRWGRRVAFAGWGLAVAIGFWGDYIMLSIILTSGLILLLFCWRELLRGAIVPLLLGLLIGSIPLLIYNFTAAPPGKSTLDLIGSLHNEFAVEQASNTMYPHKPLLSQLRGTFLVSLPMATGAPPICFDSNWVLLGRGGTIPAYSCLYVHGQRGLAIFSLSWSAGFLLLWAISTWHELTLLWRIIQLRQQAEASARRQALARHGVRLILLGNAALTLLELVLSPVAGVFPSSGRYLIALLISTPALIAPLCGLAHDHKEMKELTSETSLAPTSPANGNPRLSWARLAQPRLLLRGAALLFITATLLFGTFSIFSEIPTVQATDQAQQKLINDLQSAGVTHFYTDFWSCTRLAFLSQEHLVCVVVNDRLQAAGPTYGAPGYYTIVTSDPRSAYVFPAGLSVVTTLAKQAALHPDRYRTFTFDGYVIYQPTG